MDQKRKGTQIAVGISSIEDINKYFDSVKDEIEKGFDEYLIAYIDFLGTKERMKKDNNCKSLYEVKFILNKVREKASFIKSINDINQFDIKVFSDNIIIGLKIQEEIINDQIISLINLVSLLQFEALFQFDYPLRGGITIGEMFIDDSIVWGTGLIEAYNIENTIACYPRIIISPQIIDRYNSSDEKSINILSLLEQDSDGLWFVDFLMAVPNIRIIPNLSFAILQLAYKYVDQNAQVKKKINWILHYFNSYCHRFKDRGDFEQYTVPYV